MRDWSSDVCSSVCPWGLDLVHLETRVGKTDEVVSQVAREHGCDLVVLGWLQDLTPGRARVVRATLARSAVPVLLFRLPAMPGAPTPSR